MDKNACKYLSDILTAITEIEVSTDKRGRRYYVFRKFVERNIEIMGEAMNRILKTYPSVNITAARKIVDTRNFVIHGYDSLKPEIIWAIVINHLPLLKKEIMQLLDENSHI